MSHRANSLPDLKNKSSDFENNKVKAKERLFGWPVSDAVADILKRVKVASAPRNQGKGLAQNHKQGKYDSSADDEKG